MNDQIPEMETCARLTPIVYTPHGEPQALHNAGRLAWGSGPRGEKPDYTGLDVIIVRGDKIAPRLNAVMTRPAAERGG